MLRSWVFYLIKQSLVRPIAQWVAFLKSFDLPGITLANYNCTFKTRNLQKLNLWLSITMTYILLKQLSLTIHEIKRPTLLLRYVLGLFCMHQSTLCLKHLKTRSKTMFSSRIDIKLQHFHFYRWDLCAMRKHRKFHVIGPLIYNISLFSSSSYI